MVDSHNTAARVAEMLLKQDPPRDPLTGRLLSDLMPLQLEAVLQQYPCLRTVAPKVPDPNEVPKWDHPRPPLLRDPAPVRHAPTKPLASVRTPERTVGVAFHEAWHCAAALHNGVRVLSTTIVPDDNADGRTTMLLDRKEAPTINAFISIAAEVGDQKAESNLHPSTYDHDRDIGGSLEWREGVRRMVIEQMPQFASGAMEIARQLMVKRTLNESEINAAFARGQAQATKAVTKKARTIRRVDFSNPEHVREWNIQMGRDPNSEPVGYTQGHIVPGSYKR